MLCLTNWTRLGVAQTAAFGVTHTFFSIVLGSGAVTQSVSALQSSTARDGARVPW